MISIKVFDKHFKKLIKTDTYEHLFQYFHLKNNFWIYNILFLTFVFSQNQVADLKEMCAALKKEKAELEKMLAHTRGVS